MESVEKKIYSQLSDAILLASNQTIEQVGFGRGAAKRSLYREVLANNLANIMERKAKMPIRVVIEWPVDVISAGVEIPDSPVPIVLAVPVKEDQPVKLDDPLLYHEYDSIEHRDLDVFYPDQVELQALYAIFLNTTTQKTPFDRSFVTNAYYLAKAINAPMRGLVNFGTPEPRIYFPQTRNEHHLQQPALRYLPEMDGEKDTLPAEVDNINATSPSPKIDISLIDLPSTPSRTEDPGKKRE